MNGYGRSHEVCISLPVSKLENALHLGVRIPFFSECDCSFVSSCSGVGGREGESGNRKSRIKKPSYVILGNMGQCTWRWSERDWMGGWNCKSCRHEGRVVGGRWLNAEQCLVRWFKRRQISSQGVLSGDAKSGQNTAVLETRYRSVTSEFSPEIHCYKVGDFALFS